MTPVPSTNRESITSIGELCVGGDWACAHGDFAGLSNVARQLAAYVAEPLHCELAKLAAACRSNPDRAAALWNQLKNELYRSATA